MLKDVCSQIIVVVCFQTPSRRLKDASRRLKYVFKRTQDAFRRCCWSIEVESLIFRWCIQLDHCVCQLDDASSRIQDDSRRPNTLQDISTTFQTHTTRFQNVLLDHIGWKLDFWKMYSAKSVFLPAPRRIQGASRRLQDNPRRLKDASRRLQYVFKRTPDPFKSYCWSI